jgi:hypothetical protein
MENKSGNNVVAFGEEVNEVLVAFQDELPESVSMSHIVFGGMKKSCTFAPN